MGPGVIVLPPTKVDAFYWALACDTKIFTSVLTSISHIARISSFPTILFPGPQPLPYMKGNPLAGLIFIALFSEHVDRCFSATHTHTLTLSHKPSVTSPQLVVWCQSASGGGFLRVYIFSCKANLVNQLQVKRKTSLYQEEAISLGPEISEKSGNHDVFTWMTQKFTFHVSGFIAS